MLKILWSLALLSCVIGFNMTIDCHPKPLPIIFTDEVLTISCNFTTANIADATDFVLITRSSNEQVATCCNDTTLFSLLNNDETYQFDFCIRGKFVGRTEISFELIPAGKEALKVEKQLKITVLRKDGQIQTIFTAVVTTMVVINTFVMGMQLDWRVIITILKRPIAPAIGLCCQFLCMPLVKSN